MSFLLGARGIPVIPQLCELMVECGFDPAHITYSKVSGIEAGLVDGIPLLKFVGFLHEDAPSLDEIEQAMMLEESTTVH